MQLNDRFANLRARLRLDRTCICRTEAPWAQSNLHLRGQDHHRHAGHNVGKLLQTSYLACEQAISDKRRAMMYHTPDDGRPGAFSW